jgi:hypothetical protein
VGFRTVVVLNNDQAHEWDHDPELGRKIWTAAVMTNRPLPDGHFQYGQIIEQVHADCETLAVLDGCGGRPLTHASWYAGKTETDTEEELFKKLAKKLGYRVSRIKNPV